MTDRLRDLQRGGQTSISIDVGEDTSTNIGSSLMSNDAFAKDNTSGVSKPGKLQFFSDIDLLKKNINTIKEASTKMSDLTQETILATSNEKESELSSEINPLISTTNKKGAFTKQMLQKLKDESQTLELSQEDMKIRENLLNTLTRKFVEVMKGYQATQAKYKTEIMKKAKRQVQIVKPDATPEEVDAVVRSGGADKLIQASILKGEASESVRNMCENVNQRYNEILAIEKSVAEMHQMFLDMALLVEQQGELLDSIEFQVTQTIEFIDEGNLQMEQAIQYKKNIWKWRCYCFFFFAFCVGMVVLILKLKAPPSGGTDSSAPSKRM
jgi:t-SNARE complex subunit (syntaxin)